MPVNYTYSMCLRSNPGGHRWSLEYDDTFSSLRGGHGEALGSLSTRESMSKRVTLGGCCHRGRFWTLTTHSPTGEVGLGCCFTCSGVCGGCTPKDLTVSGIHPCTSCLEEWLRMYVVGLGPKAGEARPQAPSSPFPQDVGKLVAPAALRVESSM